MTTWEYARERVAQATPRLRYGIAVRWNKLRAMVLPTAAAGCFVAGAFTVSTLAGFVTAGFGCLYLEWRSAR